MSNETETSNNNSIIILAQEPLQPIIELITEEIENLIPDCCIQIFSNPKKGMEYILNNLKTRIIVITQYKFKGHRINGWDIFKQIREQNTLVNVIILNNISRIDRNLSNVYYTFIPTRHVYVAEPKTDDISSISKLLLRIMNQWENSFPYVFEDWIYSQPFMWSEIGFMDSETEKEYTWGDILRLVRMQTGEYKKIAKLIGICLIKINKLRSKGPVKFPVLLKIPLKELED